MRILQVGSRNQYETKVSNEDYNWIIQNRWTFGISHRGVLISFTFAVQSLVTESELFYSLVKYFLSPLVILQVVYIPRIISIMTR